MSILNSVNPLLTPDLRNGNSSTLVNNSRAEKSVTQRVVRAVKGAFSLIVSFFRFLFENLFARPVRFFVIKPVKWIGRELKRGSVDDSNISRQSDSNVKERSSLPPDSADPVRQPSIQLDDQPVVPGLEKIETPSIPLPGMSSEDIQFVVDKLIDINHSDIKCISFLHENSAKRNAYFCDLLKERFSQYNSETQQNFVDLFVFLYSLCDVIRNHKMIDFSEKNEDTKLLQRFLIIKHVVWLCCLLKEFKTNDFISLTKEPEDVQAVVKKMPPIFKDLDEQFTIEKMIIILDGYYGYFSDLTRDEVFLFNLFYIAGKSPVFMNLLESQQDDFLAQASLRFKVELSKLQSSSVRADVLKFLHMENQSA